jgi:DNA modification methylase
MKPEIDIKIGDCRDVMMTMQPNTYHCIVTSPPYWALRSYLPDWDNAKPNEIGTEKTLDEFIRTMVTVFSRAHTVLRPDGTLWLNMGDMWMTHARGKQTGLKNKDLIGLPWRVALALQADGWYLRSEIIWHKPNPVPEPDRGRPTMAHETVFLLTKNPKYFYDNDAIREKRGDEKDAKTYSASLGSNNGADADRRFKGYKKHSHSQVHPNGRQKRSVWTIGTAGFAGSHYATFPPALVEPCILAGTSEMGCCSKCGAPRKRITEFTEAYKKHLGRGWHDHKDDDKRGQRGIPAAFRGAPARVTTGWEDSCLCAAESVPCRVLDPFGGTGTVGEVALVHGRSATLIDLDSRNKAFMEQRTGACHD